MHTQKKTKIVATIGPTSDTEERIRELIQAGVNVFRFNMKHSVIEWHSERIARVQKIADELKIPTGILIDLQGPEIRIETPNKQDIAVKKGDHMLFTERFLSDTQSVAIPHPIVFDVLKAGDSLLIDDGFLEFKIVSNANGIITAEALDDCVIKHRKGLNLPGKKIDLPSLIEDDLKKLDMAEKNKVDFVALSFSRTKKDIEILREEMKKRNVNARIVAKIESQEALDHLDELIESADAIMVARGDLGIEVPIEELAYLQKMIITKCRKARKPVITATQMLQSMIDNPRPTRAEATDVANAVFDGTDAVMLSGETASGKFPVKAVSAMARIVRFNEKHATPPKLESATLDQTELIVNAAQSIITEKHMADISAVIVFTETGYTARVLSSLRPHVPIIAITDKSKTVETIVLSYAVIPYFTKLPSGSFQLPSTILEELKKHQYIRSGDSVLIVHGRHWKTPGTTNALTIVRVE